MTNSDEIEAHRVSQAEREEMLRLRIDKGMNNHQIAEAIGRSQYSVTTSIGPPGTTLGTAKWRNCLKCQKRFLSASNGNWLCGTCGKQNRAMSSSLEP